MAKRIKGSAKVVLYPKGERYFNQFPGIGKKYVLGQMVGDEPKIYSPKVSIQESNFIYPNTVNPDEAPSLAKTNNIPVATFLNFPNNMGGFTSTILPNTKYNIDSTWWSTTGGEWEEVIDPLNKEGSDGEESVYMCNIDETENQIVSIKSLFYLPAFPFICLSLRRGAPSAENYNLPYTMIKFGRHADEFALFLPYNSPCQMLTKYNDEWQKIELLGDSGRNPLAGGGAKGNTDEEGTDEIFINICSFGGNIYVSFDRGITENTSWTGWKIPANHVVEDTQMPWQNEYNERIEGPTIGAGPIEVSHTGGWFGVRWYPIYQIPKSVADTRIYSLVKGDAGYLLWNTTNAHGDPTPAGATMSESTCQTYQDRIWENNGELYTAWLDVSSKRPEALAKTIPYDPNSDTFPSDATGSWSSTEFSFRTEWEPSHWELSKNAYPLYMYDDDLPEEPLDPADYITYYSSPMVYATMIFANPVVKDRTSWEGDLGSSVDITPYVKSISVDIAEDNTVSQAKLILKNEVGQFVNSFEGQLCSIQMGYQWSNYTVDIESVVDGENKSLIFSGYVTSPGYSAAPNSADVCEVILFDPMIKLKDEKAYGLEPDFQFYSPKDSIAWIAYRAGFDINQLDLNGSTIPMYLNAPDTKYKGETDASTGILTFNEDLLVPAFGTELLDSAVEYAKKDDESLLFILPNYTYSSGYSYLYKLYKSPGLPGVADELHPLRLDGTSSTICYDIYEDASDAQYHLYELSLETIQMDPENYADYIVVKGKTKDGIDIFATKTENIQYFPDNTNFVGSWRKMKCVSRDHLQTIVDCQEVADALYKDLSRRARVITIKTDIIPGLTKGDKFKVTKNISGNRTAYADALDVEFRVISLSYNYSVNTLPRMTIIGREKV